MDYRNRHTDWNINELIFTRWSPRAYSSSKISHEKLQCILEAARWAPSCFNEQPWRFIVTTQDNRKAEFLDFLAEPNRQWAKNAPILIALIAKSDFTHNGKPNRWSGYDAGCAWGFLALEARRQGLYAHAMGGFDRAKAKEALRVPESYEIHAIIALGEIGDVSQLNEEQREREKPSNRKALEDIVFFEEFKE